MGKLADAEFKTLIRAVRTPAGATQLRKKIHAHRAAGGAMDASHYQLFFESYLKHDKKNQAVGLLDKKPDPKMVELLDECIATVRGPKSGKFLKGTGKAGWSRLGVLSALGQVCRFLGRHADACDMFERARKTVGLSGWDALSYMRAAVRTKDRDTLELALKGFERVKNEAFSHKREYEKTKQLVKTLKSRPTGTALARPKKTPSTPAAKIAEVIRVVTEAKGSAKSFDGETHRRPKPMPAAKLARLSLPNGEPPSDAMRAWLAFDASWLPLFDRKGSWDVGVLGARGAALGRLPAGVTEDTPVIELPGSASQEYLLAFGKKPKRGGDYPVLGHEKGGVWVRFPTFADFVMEYFGLE